MSSILDNAGERNDPELLAKECAQYGLPVSLGSLLRHLRGNFAATFGAKDSLLEVLESRLNRGVAAVIAGEDAEYVLACLDPHAQHRDEERNPFLKGA